MPHDSRIKLRSVSPAPPKKKERIPAQDLKRGDEILVADGGYEAVTEIRAHAQLMEIQTADGAVARLALSAMVGVRR